MSVKALTATRSRDYSVTDGCNDCDTDRPCFYCDVVMDEMLDLFVSHPLDTMGAQ